MLILCNTSCKAKESAILKSDVEESKSSRYGKIGITLFSIVIIIYVCIMLFAGEVKTTVTDSHIEIKGSYWTNYSVNLDHISSVSYAENLEKGKRTNGLGSFQLLEGHFRNDAFGDYILYAYTECDSYIILDTSDGFVVLNDETKQKTENLYTVIQNTVSK